MGAKRAPSRLCSYAPSPRPVTRCADGGCCGQRPRAVRGPVHWPRRTLLSDRGAMAAITSGRVSSGRLAEPVFGFSGVERAPFLSPSRDVPTNQSGAATAATTLLFLCPATIGVRAAWRPAGQISFGNLGCDDAIQRWSRACWVAHTRVEINPVDGPRIPVDARSITSMTVSCEGAHRCPVT